MPESVAYSIIIVLSLSCAWLVTQLRRLKRLNLTSDNLESGKNQELNNNQNESNQSPDNGDDEATFELADRLGVLNSLVDGVVLLNGEDKIAFVNKSMQGLLQSGDTVVGLTMLEAFRSQELADLVKTIRQNDSVADYKYEEHGLRDRYFRINGSIGESTNGSAPTVTLVFHDLTLTHQYERQRQDFVANVSHELRTPLSMISGYVETLINGAKEKPETLDKFLQIIEKHTNRLTWLIEDLLTISSLESGGITLSLQRCSVKDSVQQVVDELEEKASHRKISFNVSVDPDLTVNADVGRLHQILINLVDNAIKYGLPSKPIDISVGIDSDSEYLHFAVNNQGPTIPLEVKDRIFERFFRIDAARSREQGGTGLGLAIVKHLVQLHKGKVDVKSSHSDGTTFSFSIPNS